MDDQYFFYQSQYNRKRRNNKVTYFSSFYDPHKVFYLRFIIIIFLKIWNTEVIAKDEFSFTFYVCKRNISRIQMAPWS